MNHDNSETSKHSADANNTPPSTYFTDKEAFEIALQARNFEINMFWQRCNYFLWLNASVGVAYAAALARIFPTNGGADGEAGMFFSALAAVIPLIGAFICLAWIKVGLGAKFWQSYWEQILIDTQSQVGFTPVKFTVDITMDVEDEKNFFSRPGYTEIHGRVMQHLGMSEPEIFKPRGGFWRAILLFFGLFLPPYFSKYNNNVVEKPSVSGWMHKTACFFFLVWVAALLYATYRICMELAVAAAILMFLLCIASAFYTPKYGVTGDNAAEKE